MTIERVFLLPALAFLCASAFAQSVNERLVKYIDLTGEGHPENITLTLEAKDFKAAVQWTLTVRSGKKVLLRHTQHDEYTDQTFDPQSMTNCTDYIECKKKWYYHDLLNSLVIPSSRYDVEGLLNQSQGNTLYPLGKKYLARCCQIGAERAERILAKIERRIRAGTAVIITIPDTPNNAGPLLIFCPEIELFVPVYED